MSSYRGCGSIGWRCNASEAQGIELAEERTPGCREAVEILTRNPKKREFLPLILINYERSKEELTDPLNYLLNQRITSAY